MSATAALLLALAQVAEAGPAVVIFGGGGDPASTPASVDDHVVALSKVLSRAQPVVLFAGGVAAARTVQTWDPAEDRAGMWLSRVLGPEGHVGVLYRPPRAAGRAADAPGVLDAIVAASRSPRGAVIFGAGHGSPKQDGAPAALMLWNDESLAARDIAARLDASRPAGPVALVLGQCHSGAMTDLMYTGADRGEAVARPVRCVLAAAPAERTASGCTADGSSPDARAYLALFAEALGNVDGADADRNGRVSLAEAHAHAVVHDDTIDLPVRSSEAWGRAVVPALRASDWASIKGPKGLQRARPDVRAILSGLGAKVSDVAAARAEIARAEALDRQAAGELEPLERERDERLDALRRRVLGRWPELASPYQRGARALLATQADAIADFIEASPDAERWTELEASVDRIHRAIEDRARARVKVERWLWSMEAAAREAALRKRNRKAEVEIMDALLACEALEP